MKRKVTLFLSLFILAVTNIFADGIPVQTAVKVAKNAYYELSGVKQTDIVFSDQTTIEYNGEPVYYVFNVLDKKGFILVSAEDVAYPVLGYSLNSRFETENQPINVNGWFNHYSEEISEIRLAKIKANVEAQTLWTKYSADFDNFKKNRDAKAVVQPLVGDILWNQDSPWNNLCPADAAGPGGHVYAGCVATAMSIVMKYWNFPNQGIGTYSYYAGSYGTLTVNPGTTNYFFSYMNNNDANFYSEQLMYHCGVIVDMGYAPDGSGAYSQDVPAAMTTYFGYSNSTYRSKSGFTAANWNTLLKTEINAGRPIYYSGRDANNGGHAFVCSGYDETMGTDYFHFNFGWSGQSNGFYSVNTAPPGTGGFEFYYSQSCITGLQPSTTYSNSAQNVVATNSETTHYQVNITWEAPTAKSFTGFDLYRNSTKIASNLPTSQLTYTDNNAPVGINYYGVRALYSTGSSVEASDFVEVKDNYIVTFIVKKPNGTSYLTTADVTFNGQTINTDFAGKSIFETVPFGSGEYTVSNAGYATQTGTLNIFEDKLLNIQMAIPSGVEQVENSTIMFPNPAKDFIKIDNSKVTEISIYNIAGQVVLNSIDLKNSINISGLENGIYICKMKTNSRIIIQKLVKE